MDCLTKWKLGQIINEKDVQIVLEELYGGAGKILMFDATTKINPILHELYKNFEDDKDHKTKLKFSDKLCDKPFLSLNKFDIPYTHIIFTENYTIYIYD
jgi:hypothetical protein